MIRAILRLLGFAPKPLDVRWAAFQQAYKGRPLA